MKENFNKKLLFGTIIGVVTPILVLPLLIYLLSMSKGIGFDIVWEQILNNNMNTKDLLIIEKSSSELKFSSEGGKYVLEGVFGELDKKNRNNRIYTAEEYLPQIEALQAKIKASKLAFKAAEENLRVKFYDKGELTQEQYKEELQNLSNSRNTGLKIPKNYSDKSKQTAFDLILKRDKITNKIAGLDESLTNPEKQEVKENTDEESFVLTVKQPIGDSLQVVKQELMKREDIIN